MQRILSKNSIEEIRRIIFERENPCEVKIENGKVVVVEVKRRVTSRENPDHREYKE